MTKIRINDLARELEVKSKAILDMLLEVGITEKKTHSSSVEVDEAEKIRKYFMSKSSSASSRERSAPAARSRGTIMSAASSSLDRISTSAGGGGM